MLETPLPFREPHYPPPNTQGFTPAPSCDDNPNSIQRVAQSLPCSVLSTASQAGRPALQAPGLTPSPPFPGSCCLPGVQDLLPAGSVQSSPCQYQGKLSSWLVWRRRTFGPGSSQTFCFSPEGPGLWSLKPGRVFGSAHQEDCSRQ